jgi:nucleotide-binding universal stress UspA family protein
VDRLARAEPAIRAEFEVLRGDPADRLRSCLRPGVLLAVGTGRSRPRRFGWSVAERLAAAGRGTLAVVPTSESGARAGVLVGVNGSPASVAAAAFAAGEAMRLDGALTIVHTWQKPASDSPITGLNREFVDWLESQHRVVLDEAAAAVRSQFPALRVECVLESGAASDALLARSRGAALLVTGSRGLGAIRRTVLGSVSHSLLLGIECPTVIVNTAGGV